MICGWLVDQDLCVLGGSSAHRKIGQKDEEHTVCVRQLRRRLLVLNFEEMNHRQGHRSWDLRVTSGHFANGLEGVVEESDRVGYHYVRVKLIEAPWGTSTACSTHRVHYPPTNTLTTVMLIDDKCWLPSTTLYCWTALFLQPCGFDFV